MSSILKNRKYKIKERATGTACYLCGNGNYKQKDGCVRDNARLKVLECCNCGLVFLSSFDHVGREFYENSGMHGESPRNFHELLNEAVLDDERRFEFTKPLLINCSVLDFGCGTGGFLHRVKSLARVAHGIELEKRFAKDYQQMDMQVFANISSVPDGNCYDIITLFHVLEHLPDPKATLILLSRFLKENGKIIIEVPNSDDALLTLYQCKDFQSFTYWSCHLYLFNSSTLSKLAEQAGLKINYIKQVQRYSLANHLYWLCQGKPGGHQHWQFFNTPELHRAYEAQLAALGKCDTLMMSLSFC